MKLFDFNGKTEYIIIVGCGSLGANIGINLSDAGKDVLIIDKDKEAFGRLSTAFGGLTITGDGTDLEILEKNHIQKADTVIAVTNYDNTNIMIGQIAKEMYNVKSVIARLFDYERASVYKDLGIDTVCPEVLSEKEFSNILQKDLRMRVM